MARNERPKDSESGTEPLILSVCETARGGVGRYQENLQMLATRGFGFAVLLPQSDRDILTQKVSAHGFPRRRRGPKAIYALIRAFLLLRRRLRPDLYFFNSTFSLVALAVLRLVGDRTPAVYCAHCWAITNYDRDSPKGRLVRLIEGRLCGLADLVVNVSHGDRELAENLGYAGRHVVIENAVPDSVADADQVPFARGSEKEVHLLFVGRFDRQKGVDVLLPAFARARARAPHLRLHLVGSPVRDGSLPGMPEGASYHGWVSAEDIDAYYAAADALIVSSRWEGLPLIVPEALRNGTPVLVSDRSGLPDLIEPGRTGVAFALDEEALADCLAGLDADTLRALRPAARQSYEERFAMQRFLDEMSAQLHALLAEKA